VAWPVGAVLGLRASLGSLVVCLFFLRSCSLAGVFSFFFSSALVLREASLYNDNS
jgi:hypothetical protein